MLKKTLIGGINALARAFSAALMIRSSAQGELALVGAGGSTAALAAARMRNEVRVVFIEPPEPAEEIPLSLVIRSARELSRAQEHPGESTDWEPRRRPWSIHQMHRNEYFVGMQRLRRHQMWRR